ncbi:MAG: nickel pincer cofactor biosynthesis protein LarB [Firmicutes bacterium]|nr:nickel pincer cofactor biosynthesis protein LarB [Bacillota bacterium]
MDDNELRTLLQDIQHGTASVEEGIKRVRSLLYEDLGFARVDLHREIRQGFPEVVFCQGKTAEQIVAILERLAGGRENVLATRANPEIYARVKERIPGAIYNDLARIILLEKKPGNLREGKILVVSAGTADLPVAEEAAVTAAAMGNEVQRLYDVGVAGIHRLLDKQEDLRRANVIIVVAGMEGALASVVGGLVDKPVIAVPTSVGYGANFGGLSALLGMLNSCVAGVAVVNIDNGFGAGYLASTINRLASGGKGGATSKVTISGATTDGEIIDRTATGGEKEELDADR